MLRATLTSGGIIIKRISQSFNFSSGQSRSSLIVTTGVIT